MNNKNTIWGSLIIGISNNRVLQHSIENNELPGIPYTKIGDNYIFSKKLLNNWVQDAIGKKSSFKITSPDNQSYEVEVEK